MSTPKEGQISLGGKNYRIQLGQGQYKGRDVVDFAPKASVPGGGTTYSQLGLYQPLTQIDWRHGFGYLWHTDPMGYADTIGNIDTRQSGLITLFTTTGQLTSVNPSTTTGFIESPDKVYIIAYGTAGAALYNRQTHAWTTITALNGINILTMWTNGKFVFAVTNNGRVKANGTGAYPASFTPDATYLNWADVGVNANSANYIWCVSHDGFVYFGKGPISGVGQNEVYFASKDNLSDLNGTFADDPSRILIGPAGTGTLGAVSFNGNLIVFRKDGLYQVAKDRSGATRVLDYRDISGNLYIFSFFCVYNGQLIFSVGNRIQAWNGVRTTDITPPRLNDTFPYTFYTNFRYGVQYGTDLFVIGRTNSADYNTAFNEDLLCYDGVGWTRPVRLTLTSVYGSEDVVNGFTLLPYNGTVAIPMFAYNFSCPSNVSKSGIYQLFLNNNSDFAYAQYPTSGENSLITSRYDAGYRLITKSTNALLVQGSNLSVGHRYIKIFYSLDQGAWTPWGQLDGSTNVVNVDGITRLVNPLNSLTGKSTIEYHQMRIKIQLVTDSTFQTPVVEGLTTMLIMRPDLAYGWAINVIAESNLENAVGRTETRNVRAILGDLRTARNSKAPLVYKDPFGDTYSVYITSIQEIGEEEVIGREGLTPTISHMVQINLIQVT